MVSSVWLAVNVQGKFVRATAFTPSVLSCAAVWLTMLPGFTVSALAAWMVVGMLVFSVMVVAFSVPSLPRVVGVGVPRVMMIVLSVSGPVWLESER